MKISGAQMLFRALKKEGVDTVFAYPGGAAIDLFDALFGEEDINFILPRHEQALIFAADGYARATGKPGVCLVTSGPGATNLVTGIASANFDSVPLICITAQVPTALVGNDAFQEIDIVGITRNICKYCVTVRRREELPVILKKAFQIACTGKPGPVVVDIPKDVQRALGDGEYPEFVQIRGYKPNESVHLGQLKKAMGVLRRARRPLFLLGGGIKIAGAGEAIEQVIDEAGVPFVTTMMGKGCISTDHPLFLGGMGMHGTVAANRAVRECDVLFSIGCRFNDRVVGVPEKFAPKATIIHADIDPAAISRNVSVDIPLVADARNVAEAMLEKITPLSVSDWIEETAGWREIAPENLKDLPGVTPDKIMADLNRQFDECIYTTDVGQNQLWAAQYLHLDRNKPFITAGGLAPMGFGLPAAIGAQIGAPDKSVVCITGDGGFQMNLQELATAQVLGLPVIVCLLNNGYLGNVRQWQELFHEKQYSLTCLRKNPDCPPRCKGPGSHCRAPYYPDFIRLAESYGALAIRVTREEEIALALETAAAERGRVSVIEFVIDCELNVFPMIPAGKSLDDVIL